MTYTYAELAISQAAYSEIRNKLEAAGYQHAFHQDRDGELIDMHGIAVRAEAPKTSDPTATVSPEEPRRVKPPQMAPPYDPIVEENRDLITPTEER